MSMTQLLKQIVTPPRGLFFGKYTLNFSGRLSYATYIRPRENHEKHLQNMLSMQAEAYMRFRKSKTASTFFSLPDFLNAKTIADLPSDSEIDRLFAEHRNTLLAIKQAIVSLPANEIRVVYSYSSIKLYTNNKSHVDCIASLPGFTNPVIQEIRTVLPPNHYSRATVKYKYRTYMRAGLIAPEIATALAEYLNAATTIGTSPAFATELKRSARRSNRHIIRSHFFVDHNDLKELGFLQLISPGLLGRTITFEPKV